MGRFFILDVKTRKTIAEGETLKDVPRSRVDVALRERRAILVEPKSAPDRFIVTDAESKATLARGRKDPAMSDRNLVARLRKGSAAFDVASSNAPLPEFSEEECAEAAEARTPPPEPPKVEPPKVERPKVETAKPVAKDKDAKVLAKLLAEKHSRPELIALAKKAGATYSERGTKEELALEIIEAEAQKKARRGR